MKRIILFIGTFFLTVNLLGQTGTGWAQQRAKMNFKDSINIAKGWMIDGTVVLPSVAEINYLDGVSSAIQTQIDARKYFPYDYYIEEVAGTVYARPSPNTSLTAYSDAALHTVLNNAITALNTAGGGTIVIKEGTYTATSMIILDDVSNINIIGIGNVVITKTANDVSFPYYSTIYMVGTLNRIKIENIVFANSNTEAADQNEGYIYIRSATGNILDADSIEIAHCGFRRTEVNMRAIQVLATRANSDINHLSIHDCWFDDIRNMAIEILNQEDTYAALTKLKNISICDNYFYSTGSQSISVVGGTRGLVIKGNIAIDVAGSMIELANTRDVIVSENIMNNTSIEGQFLITTTSVFTTPHTGNVRIENNIAHCYNPSPDGYSVTGLYIYKADTIDIIGNTIYAELNEIKESHYVNVINNRLITTGRNAIKYSSASTYGYIANNYLDNVNAYGGTNTGTIYFVDSGTTNNTATNNIIKNTDDDDIIEAGSAAGNHYPYGNAEQYVLKIGDRGSATIATVDSIAKESNKLVFYDGASQIDPLITDTINLSSVVPLLNDTIPLFVFGGGGGNDGDSTVFTTSTVYGSFFNAGSDTLVITELRAVMATGSKALGNDTLDINVYWHSTFLSGSATKLNTTDLPINSITTGTTDTSFNNAKIPPGVFVWCKSPAVILGRKPEMLVVQISGYKIPKY